MTQFEKAEIRRLPKKYRPMGAWGYFWHIVLYDIPVIGWICLIWGAVNDNNICRRSFARYFFISFAVAIILVAVIAVLFVMGLVNAEMLTGVLNSVNPGEGV